MFVTVRVTRFISQAVMMPDPDTNLTDVPPDGAAQADAAAPANAPLPMTPSLLGRLFGVPLLIVTFVVGSVILVVVGFGWIATGQQRSILSLVETLEAGGGEKNAFGMLAPKDKAYWQAAKELADRLKDKDNELDPEQRPVIAGRLAAMITKTESEALSDGERTTLQFLMLALARLGEPAGIDVLIDSMSSPDPEVRWVAVMALRELRDVDEIGRAVPGLSRLVKDQAKEVRMVACWALANMARPEHAEAVEALSGALLDDRDVAWNAAIALGHLGSAKATPMLASMLERSYWENIVGPAEDPTGQRRRQLSDLRIQTYLIAAMNAASRLDDPRLTGLIDRLKDDTDLKVRQTARELIGTPPVEVPTI